MAAERLGLPRLVDEQMHVFRHDHVPDHDEAIASACGFQGAQKQVAPAWRPKQRPAQALNPRGGSFVQYPEQVSPPRERGPAPVGQRYFVGQHDLLVWAAVT